MGTDYAARKSAKSKWKKAGSAAQADARGSRKRKAGGKRRLCQGMCYSEPVLTGEDKAWSDGPSDLYDSDVEEPQTSPNKVPVVPAEVEEPSIAERPAKRLRMSTSVSIAGPAPPQPSASSQQQNSAQEAEKVVKGAAKTSAALSGLPAEMQRIMQAEGHAEPTPVQLRCWPPILTGRDVQAVAKPGSGKTFGYLLPAMSKLLSGRQDSAPCRVLILVPTRELVQQVADSCSSLRKLYKLKVACILGGSDRAAQAQSLAGSPDIIVATPGRLLDLANASNALSDVSYVVLDEADKMLSLGFKAQLDQIWTYIVDAGKHRTEEPRQRPQVLLFTATMPAEVATAAAQWQQDPISINMELAEAQLPASNVTQVVQVCAEHKKPRKLQKHLEQVKARTEQERTKPRILIFCNKVKTVRFVHTLCVDAGFKTAMLHGERSQAEREAALHAFKNGTAQVLVATDVAGRGLHIKMLPYVVNYDFPSRMEAYIHRVGRTGRLASSGHAFSFFTRNLAPLARPLLNHLLNNDQSVDPNLVKLADAFDIASTKLKEASVHPADDACSPALLAVEIGVKAEKSSKVKSKKKRRNDVDDSSVSKMSASDEAPVATSSLPGLYKSRRLPAIAAEAVRDYNSDSDSGNPAAAPGKQPRLMARKAQVARLESIGKQKAAKLQQAPPGSQQLIKNKGLKDAKDEHAVGVKKNALKRSGREALPGRLRKKLAKDRMNALEAKA